LTAMSNPSPDGMPVSYMLRLVDGSKRWGVAERDLFRGLELRREDLLAPDATIPISVAEALIERARALSKEPALGIYQGLRMSVAAHGFPGFAAMSASTLRDALLLATRYAPTRTKVLTFHLEESRPAALVVEERADVGTARDFVLLSLLVGFWRIGTALLGRETGNATVHVAFAEPAYYERFRHVPPRLEFGQSANRIVFDASLLDAQLVTADLLSLRLASAQCEHVLASTRACLRFVDRARQLVLRGEGGARSLIELAEVMNVSSRTLRRRLAEEGASYSDVLDKERHARSLVLLCSPGLSIKDVAARLGYLHVTNFTRAFHRWTGETPATFRSAERV
jgi:AraC-like DNA-binding protein